MALSITATVDADTLAVRLTITGGTPDYTVQAAPGGDRLPYTVRSTYSPISGDPTGRVALDGDAPLNTPTQYVVTDKAGQQAQTGVVEPVSDHPVLADATDPSRAMAVVVVSQPPNEWEARSVWWDVLGQRAPFVSVAPMRLRSGELVLHVPDRSQRARLMNLLAVGNPMVLRSACPPAVDDVVLLPTVVRDELVMESNPAGARMFTITYQAVARELGPYTLDPGRTYASLPTESVDYAAVVGKFTDYAALLSGQPYAGLGAEQLANGSFTSALSGWGLFWTSTGMAWDSSAGTALSRNDGTDPNGYANLNQVLAAGIPATGARLLRLSGRVRSTAQGSGVYVQLWTNKAPDLPQPFAPGVVLVNAPVAAGPAWSAFAVDLAVTDPAHDVAAVFLRGDAMAPGAVVEWDDVSARWHT
jgi:hypothetical protein